MTQITKVLVANRGEIARRIFATCKDEGIQTAAVFTEADRDLPFVHEADHAMLSGRVPPVKAISTLKKS